MRFFLLLGLLFPALVSGQTSLWRISKGTNQLYIGGTVHMLSQSDYPLPDEFEQAFREIDILVLETDLDGLLTPEAQLKIKDSLTYNSGSNLKDNLKPKTFQALKRYCKSNGLSIDAMMVMKPSLVVLTLTLAEMNRLGLAGAGVDQFFLNKAKSAGKKISGLESAEAQIRVLEDMGKGREDELILSTLGDLIKMQKYMDEMKKAWRIGNMADLANIGIESLQTEFPEFNKSLLIDRNNSWLPKIKAMLNTPKRELILVGALHLSGDDGILAMLKKQGYVVEAY
jgi:uncharacterized protein